MPEDRNYRFWDDTPHPFGNTGLQLRGIAEDNLSWLPISKVPILSKYLLFNSIEQPVLSIFKRVEWNGHLDKGVLYEFLKKHTKEMGYVIVHQGDFLGVVGVEYHDCSYPGLATIFNARVTTWEDEPSRCKKELRYPRVPVLASSAKVEIKKICYERGARAYDRDIKKDYCGMESIDD